MSSAEPREVRVVLAQAFAAALVVLSAVPSAGQSLERSAATLVDAINVVAADPSDAEAPGPPVPAPADAGQAPFWIQPTRVPAPPERPALLLPLYASFGLLQVMDAHSTLDAVRGGAVERNPLIAPFGDNPGALYAIKAATTAGTIVLAEKLWRRHPTRAVVVMVAVNAAYAAIVAANYRK